MSEILDLARNFNEKSKQLAERTESELTSEFKRQGRVIGEVLKSSERSICGDIQGSTQTIRESLLNREQTILAEIREQNIILGRTLLNTWLIVLLTVIPILLITWGYLYYQGGKIMNNRILIERQEETLKALADKGANIQLSRCGAKGEKSRLCVQIDEKEPPYQGGYRILKGY